MFCTKKGFIKKMEVYLQEEYFISSITDFQVCGTSRDHPVLSICFLFMEGNNEKKIRWDNLSEPVE